MQLHYLPEAHPCLHRLLLCARPSCPIIAQPGPPGPSNTTKLPFPPRGLPWCSKIVIISLTRLGFITYVIGLPFHWVDGKVCLGFLYHGKKKPNNFFGQPSTLHPKLLWIPSHWKWEPLPTGEEGLWAGYLVSLTLNPLWTLWHQNILLATKSLLHIQPNPRCAPGVLVTMTLSTCFRWLNVIRERAFIAQASWRTNQQAPLTLALEVAERAWDGWGGWGSGQTERTEDTPCGTRIKC